MSLWRALPLACVLAATESASMSAQLAVTGSRTNTTLPVSPSVVAMYIGTRIEPGMERLDLLVLWRGEPGWFARSGGASSGGSGGSTDAYRIRFRFGETHIEAVLDPRADTAAILGQTFDLRRANVILVDGAGTQAAVVGTLGLQAQVLITPGTMLVDRMPAVIFAQKDIRAFLRCDKAAPTAVSYTRGICGSTGTR